VGHLTLLLFSVESKDADMAKGCYCKKNEKWPASRTNIGIHGPRKDSSFRDEMLSALLKVS
jgi:hypothetical protein